MSYLHAFAGDMVSPVAQDERISHSDISSARPLLQDVYFFNKSIDQKVQVILK